jgi:hypothetical protein
VLLKGRRQVKECILSLETIETWIVYVCHSEGEWARQKDLSALERAMVVGVRHTGLSVSKTAMLLGFSTLNSFLCVSRMVHQPKGIWPKGVQLNIRNLILMFCTLRVYVTAISYT